jgi:hypothetical protein
VRELKRKYWRGFEQALSELTAPLAEDPELDAGLESVRPVERFDVVAEMIRAGHRTRHDLARQVFDHSANSAPVELEFKQFTLRDLYRHEIETSLRLLFLEPIKRTMTYKGHEVTVDVRTGEVLYHDPSDVAEERTLLRTGGIEDPQQRIGQNLTTGADFSPNPNMNLRAREGYLANNSVLGLHTHGVMNSAGARAFEPTQHEEKQTFAKVSRERDTSDDFGWHVAEALTAGALILYSFVPGVGESMDLVTLLSKDEPTWARVVAGLSLAVGLLTLGASPNIGGVARAERRLLQGRQLGHDLSASVDAFVMGRRGGTVIKETRFAELQHLLRGEHNVILWIDSQGQFIKEGQGALYRAYSHGSSLYMFVQE